VDIAYAVIGSKKKRPKKFTYDEEFVCDEECLSIAYGSFLRSLERFDLRCYLDKGSTATSSLNKLREQLNSVQIHSKRHREYNDNFYASGTSVCRIASINDRFHKDINLVFDGIEGFPTTT